MDHLIQGCRRGHRILEDLAPLAEDEIVDDQHRPTLIAFGQQGEERCHLFPVLLRIPEVIGNVWGKAVAPFQFGREQALDKSASRVAMHAQIGPLGPRSHLGLEPDSSPQFRLSGELHRSMPNSGFVHTPTSVPLKSTAGQFRVVVF